MPNLSVRRAPRMGAGFDNAGQHLFLQDCFGDATPCSGAPMDDDEMKRLSKLKTGVRKKKKKKLSFDKLGRIQYKLKAASYTAGGMDWHNLFKQYVPISPERQSGPAV